MILSFICEKLNGSKNFNGETIIILIFQPDKRDHFDLIFLTLSLRVSYQVHAWGHRIIEMNLANPK